MTATTTGDPARMPPRQPLPPQWMPAVTGRPASRRTGRVVAAQVALALPLAALGRGAGVLAVACVGALLLLVVWWARLRGRPLVGWLGVAVARLARRRALPSAGAAELVDLVSPGAVVRPVELAGGPAAVLDDATGLTALLEVGDPGDLLGGGSRVLPGPASLLPPASAESPPVCVQLLLGAAPAPAPSAADGTAGTSYRQLTDGRLPGRSRALLAVRVLRVDGWSDEDLRRALSGTVRRIVRRLEPSTARPLGASAALLAVADLAHHDDGAPVRESWQAVRTGELLQSCFRVRLPADREPAGAHLVSRVLATPATATTVSICAGPRTGTGAGRSGLTVRLAARTPAELAAAAQVLRRSAAELGAEVRRLDGEQLVGLAATLPLAAAPGAGHDGDGPAELTLGDAGLMVGANRHGGAVTVRLFRPEGTRVLLVGGLRAAQLITVRAMALGAAVVVQTGRPRSWEPFVRGVAATSGTIPVLPPGRPVGDAPGTSLRPLLLVLDVGPVPADPAPGPAWRSTLVVRDELTPADVDALARADLAVLQPLDPAEAALAGTALGLGGTADWLTRIREDMVAVVNRRALRWALLSPTPIESQVIGRPARR
ncbi:type VII secretion protein EccE [Micromonospora siamensis]|uniref:Type VII secretion protein EccE n=1 Tax=Micromonospora siamensis TaxID=299152 RepID=A0A1C5H369_9ACTN|nr:type VII secretion protein EccE [Micromonospora siamensis]SCG40495.1 type VII secretion protein EccE [Micromonospora siamensis]